MNDDTSAAKQLGRKGGLAKTEAQQEARRRSLAQNRKKRWPEKESPVDSERSVK